MWEQSLSVCLKTLAIESGPHKGIYFKAVLFIQEAMPNGNKMLLFQENLL